MAIWPFFRHGKRSRKQAEEEAGPGGVNPPPHPGDSSPSVTKASRGGSKRRKRNNGQSDFGSSYAQMAHTPRQPAPLKHASTTNIPPTGHRWHGLSTPDRVPTLYARRRSTEANVLRRRSDKRKRDDYAREQALKNTGVPSTVLKRHATFTHGQSPVNSRQGPTAASGHTDLRASDLSIPIQQADRFSLSEFADSYAFKLSTFHVLAPRPLLRYAETPRPWLPSSVGLSRHSTKKDKKPMIREEDLGRDRRIEELADDLDAGALRELMERHRRRREMKRQDDQEKLRRKLQQRADRQQEEVRQGRTGAEQELGSNRVGERSAASGRDLGTAADSSALDQGHNLMEIMEERSRSGSWLQDPSKESLVPSPTACGGGRQAIEATGDPRSLQGIGIAISQGIQEAEAPSISAISRDRDSASSPQLPGVAQESTPDMRQPFESEKRLSDTGGKISNAWASLFRRSGSRLRKASVDRPKLPPDLSKTSRESLPSSLLPQDVGPPPPIPERSILRTTAIPRSQSKFVEHLNDFPLPPVGSHSQPQDVTMAIKDRPPSPSVGMGVGTAEGYTMSMRSTVATPEPGREDHRSSGAGSPEPRPESGFIAQSLASIDSEGSWLSGKPVRRPSQARASQAQESAGSTREKLDDYADLGERGDVAGDENFNRYAIDHEENLNSATHKTGSNAMDLDNDTDDDVPPIPTYGAGVVEEDEGTLRASVGKRTVLVHPLEGPRSKEALFQDYQANESEPATPDGGDSPLEVETFSEIRRATSVDLGKGHIRHISAGSARLLDVPRRLSDAKRLSSGSAGSGAPPSDSMAEENQQL